MHLFRRRKAPSLPTYSQTRTMNLIGGALQQQARCPKCRRPVDGSGVEPFSEIPCPHCQAMVLIPGDVGGYWAYRLLDSGGMGVVYKAVSAEFPDETFAVKLLPLGREDDARLIASLHNEAVVLRHFRDHPNIMQFVEFGQAANEYFLVSKFVAGLRLDRRIVALGVLRDSEAVALALELLGIERFIVRQGYLYRDWKPENLILRADGSPVLVDFGLCRPLTEAARPEEGDEVDGAPHFMPPERLTGGGERVCSEIYSIGMLLYYVLTGQTFFASGPAAEVVEQYVYGDRSSSKLPFLRGVKAQLGELIHRMIAPDPALRHQSLERLEEQLRACL
jgi:eukaryotic-like serine/threonine-protein kinase